MGRRLEDGGDDEAAVKSDSESNRLSSRCVMQRSREPAYAFLQKHTNIPENAFISLGFSYLKLRRSIRLAWVKAWMRIQ